MTGTEQKSNGLQKNYYMEYYLNNWQVKQAGKGIKEWKYRSPKLRRNYRVARLFSIVTLRKDVKCASKGVTILTKKSLKNRI